MRKLAALYARRKSACCSASRKAGPAGPPSSPGWGLRRSWGLRRGRSDLRRGRGGLCRRGGAGTQNQRQAGRQQHQRSFHSSHSSSRYASMAWRSISLTSSTPLPGTWRRRWRRCHRRPASPAPPARSRPHAAGGEDHPPFLVGEEDEGGVDARDVEQLVGGLGGGNAAHGVVHLGYGNALMVHFGVLNNVVLGDGALQVVLEQLLDRRRCPHPSGGERRRPQRCGCRYAW